MKRIFLIGGLVMVAALIAPALAWADPLRVSAALDRNVVPMGETVTLSVSVSGGGQAMSEPLLPPLDDFAIVSSGMQTNMVMNNGDVSMSMTRTYVLSPKKVGKFAIGPIKANENGQTAQSEPLQVEVVQGVPSRTSQATSQTSTPPAVRQGGLQPPPPGTRARGAAFVTAEVDNANPYVGQGITYILRFYHNEGVSGGNLQYPDTTGFINEELPPQKRYRTMIDGRAYDVNELRVALFPTAEGTKEIGAAHLRCRVIMLPRFPTMPGMDPDFDSMLAESVDRELVSDSVKVNVRPLPTEGQPEDFTGAVGHYVLDAHLDDEKDARVGQALNLELSIIGEGDVNLIQAPHLPPMADFKAYPAVASGDLIKKNYKVTGTRKFTVVLVPNKAGRLEIPPVTMSYFDPADGKYHTLTTRSMEVAVAPGAGPAAASTAGGSGEANDRGLRPLHTESALSTPFDLLESPLFRAIQCIPLAIVAVALVLWGPKLRRAPRVKRRGSALRRAQNQLRDLPEKAALSDLPPVLYTYLTEKLGTHAAGLSVRELMQRLRERGVADDEISRLEQLLEIGDRARYTGLQPDAVQVRERMHDAESLLSNLERRLKSPTKNEIAGGATS